MKKFFFTLYLFVGLTVCAWFTCAAYYGWKSVDFGIVNNNSSSGRSYGGSWGGGK